MATGNVVDFRPKALTKQEMKKSVILKRIGESFRLIQREPIEEVKRFPNEGRLIYGAFNLPVYRLEGGLIHHVAGEHIDLMRPSREYTRNAIELRCDALGLVIYLGGMILVDDEAFSGYQGNPVGRGVRVTVYHFKKERPTEIKAFIEPSQLFAKLHKTLLETFNDVASKYNIAGISDNCLVLRSSHEQLFPDIPLGLSDMENPV